MSFNSNLSPGLHRRLQYSNYVRFRNLRPYRQRSSIDSISNTYNTYNTNLNAQDYLHDEINNDISFKNLYHYTKVKINNEHRFCPICQSDIGINTEIIRELNCCHIYHIDCIDKWLLIKNECPLCKNII